MLSQDAPSTFTWIFFYAPNLSAASVTLAVSLPSGEDKVFYKASAKTGKKPNIVVVASKRVSNPVAVRYGFRNVAPASVFNNFGIPAAPFRTDNWE